MIPKETMTMSLRTVRILVVLAFPILALPARAQRTPGAFLGMTPKLPENACSAKLDERTAFLRTLQNLDHAIDEELRRRAKENKEVKAAEKDAAEKAGKRERERYGLDDQTTKALKHMSKEERRAWGMAHAGEIMAGANGNPSGSGQYSQMSSLMVQGESEGLAMAEKRRALLQRLEDLEESTKPSRIEISKIEQKLAAPGLVGSAAGAAESNKLERQLAVLRQRFCARFSPTLLSILSDYQDYTKKAIAASDKEEGREADVKKMATGVSARREPGTEGLKKVKEYFRELSHVFKYDLEAAVNGGAHG